MAEMTPTDLERIYQAMLKLRKQLGDRAADHALWQAFQAANSPAEVAPLLEEMAK